MYVTRGQGDNRGERQGASAPGRGKAHAASLITADPESHDLESTSESLIEVCYFWYIELRPYSSEVEF